MTYNSLIKFIIYLVQFMYDPLQSMRTVPWIWTMQFNFSTNSFSICACVFFGSFFLFVCVHGFFLIFQLHYFYCSFSIIKVKCHFFISLMHVPVTSKMIYSNACIMFKELCFVLYLVNEGMLLVLSFYILEKNCMYNIFQVSIFMYFTWVLQQTWPRLCRSVLSTWCSHCSNQHHIQLCADISWKQSRK